MKNIINVIAEAINDDDDSENDPWSPDVEDFAKDFFKLKNNLPNPKNTKYGSGSDIDVDLLSKDTGKWAKAFDSFINKYPVYKIDEFLSEISRDDDDFESLALEKRTDNLIKKAMPSLLSHLEKAKENPSILRSYPFSVVDNWFDKIEENSNIQSLFSAENDTPEEAEENNEATSAMATPSLQHGSQEVEPSDGPETSSVWLNKSKEDTMTSADYETYQKVQDATAPGTEVRLGGRYKYSRGAANDAQKVGTSGFNREEYSQNRREYWEDIQDGLRAAVGAEGKQNSSKLLAAIRKAGIGHIGGFLSQIQQAKARANISANQAKKEGYSWLAPVYQVSNLINDSTLSDYEEKRKSADVLYNILLEKGVAKELQELLNDSKALGISLIYNTSHPFRVPYSLQFEKQLDRYVKLLNELNSMERASENFKKGQEEIGGMPSKNSLSKKWDPSKGREGRNAPGTTWNPTKEEMDSASENIASIEKTLVGISTRIISIYNNIISAFENALVSNWVGPDNNPESSDYGQNGNLSKIFSKYWPQSYDEYEEIGAKLQNNAREMDASGSSYEQLYTVYYFMPRTQNSEESVPYEHVEEESISGFTLPRDSELKKEQVNLIEQNKMLLSKDPDNFIVTAAQKPVLVFALNPDGSPMLDSYGIPVEVVLPLERKVNGSPQNLKVTVRMENGKKRSFYTAKRMVRSGLGTMTRPPSQEHPEIGKADTFDLEKYSKDGPDFDHDRFLEVIGYDPNEIVKIRVWVNDEIEEIEGVDDGQTLTRSKLSRKGWLENNEIDLVEVFPVGRVDPETGAEEMYQEPVIYAVSSEAESPDGNKGPSKLNINSVRRMNYEEYTQLAFAQRELYDAIKDKRIKRELNPKEKYLYDLRLPLKTNGEVYSEEEILNGDYDPVDNNGSRLEKKPYTNFDGNKVEYSKIDISETQAILQSIRLDNSSLDTNDLVYMRTGDGFEPWILYNRDIDDGSPKMPAEAIKIKLPPSSDSFVEVFETTRRGMGLAILDCEWDGPYLVVKEFPWAVKNFDWDREPEVIASELGINPKVVQLFQSSIESGEEVDYKKLEEILIEKGSPQKQASKNAMRIYKTIAKTNWVLNKLTDVPLPEALRMARSMWYGYKHPVKLSVKKGADIQFFEDPNNQITSSLDPKSKMNNKSDLEKNLKCSNIVMIDGQPGECKSKLPANNTRPPKQIAEINSDGQNTDWEMVSKGEAELRDKIARIDDGEDDANREDLIQKAERIRAKPPIDNFSPICDRCWAFDFEVIPDKLFQDMLTGIHEIYEISRDYLGQSIDKSPEIKNKIKDALVRNYVVPYIRKFWTQNGPVFKIYQYINDGTQLTPKYKELFAKPLGQHYRTISQGLFHLLGPILEADALEPKSNLHFFSIAVLQLMNKIKNFWFWASGTRYATMGKPDPRGSIDRENQIRTFSSLTRKDVRDAQALSNALRSIEPNWRGKWNESMRLDESVHRLLAPRKTIKGNFCRVAIKGFINEESAFNGLLGYLVKNCDDGTCVVELDPNDLIKESMVKVYPGELDIIWDTRRKSKLEAEKDNYIDFINELKSNEMTEQRIIDIIGDNTNEYLFR